MRLMAWQQAMKLQHDPCLEDSAGEQSGFDPHTQVAGNGGCSLFALSRGSAFAELGEAFAGQGGVKQVGLEGFDGAPLGLVILAD